MINKEEIEWEIEKHLEEELDDKLKCKSYVYFMDDFKKMTISIHDHNNHNNFNIDIILNIINEYGFKYVSKTEFLYRISVFCERC